MRGTCEAGSNGFSALLIGWPLLPCMTSGIPLSGLVCETRQPAELDFTGFLRAEPPTAEPSLPSARLSGETGETNRDWSPHGGPLVLHYGRDNGAFATDRSRLKAILSWNSLGISSALCGLWGR